MMQQILRDMYIDPDLLAELNEEQKHILFYKIRQEQVRRWTERESQESSPPGHPQEGGGKRVQWLLGSDGDVWVWVMGDAPGDMPYEQIVSKLMEERAKRQAQHEAQELWRAKQAEIEQKFRDAMAKEKARFVAEKWREETEDRKAAKQEEIHIQEELKGPEEPSHLKCYLRHSVFHLLTQPRVSSLPWPHSALLLVPALPFPLPKPHPTVRRSKAADEEMTRKARWARDEYRRQSLRAIEKGRVAGLSGLFQEGQGSGLGHTQRHSAMIEPSYTGHPTAGTAHHHTGLQPAAPPLYRRRQSPWVRPVRPCSRESILLWFREEQRPKQAGYERNSSSIAPWFHEILSNELLCSGCSESISLFPSPLGIISREESEAVLMNAGEGCFLVRVSELIWGYTLSYRTASGFKHFLIDASGDYYSFLGVDQMTGRPSSSALIGSWTRHSSEFDHRFHSANNGEDPEAQGMEEGELIQQWRPQLTISVGELRAVGVHRNISTL
ncbi:hypothetical protein JZ751_011050 [Albula glossodonta]|uniref:SH2 domain-containing protein n=1 Tax=Albula glossodonta TaxID=121402 RepID=A0A8T2NZ16_9TELE|nr:hypothetical protein JZ751_011050 [Albula glossodonta]